MPDFRDSGFGANGDLAAAVIPAVGANVQIVNTDCRVRTIAGPAEIHSISASVINGIGVSVQDCAFRLLVLKTTAPVTSDTTANAVLRWMDGLRSAVQFARYCRSFDRNAFEFAPGTLACREGEYLHVVVSGALDLAGVDYAVITSLTVTGRALGAQTNLTLR